MSFPSRGIVAFAITLLALIPGAFAQAKELRARFKFPQEVSFRLEETRDSGSAVAPECWVRGWAMDSSTNSAEFGEQVVVQLASGTALESILRGSPLTLSRTVTSNVFILQATSALTAAKEATRIAELPGVLASYPVVRKEAALDGLYAPRPNDPHFHPFFGGVIGQWNLENRDQTNGTALGPDLNIRAAWPYTRGEGVVIAIGDTGIQIAHRELTNRSVGTPHRNFGTGVNNPAPFSTSATWAHGTECAGLAAAETDNGFGMAGVAPQARLAGWVVFTNTASLRLVSDDRLMDMFQYASNIVGVQNHSWTHNTIGLAGLTVLENTGIENAVRQGRGGKGVVIVRAAGNDRQRLASPNDDAYTSDPRVITVAAVGRSGRVPTYSERGAAILVAAPSGDPGSSGLFTTDLVGATGVIPFPFFPPFDYLWDFAFNTLGFSGTSAASPQVAGVAALLLSANTNLTYRDVQQILLLSARHFDAADPDLKANAAGLLVSHNDGFGVPDAGYAVKLARAWVNRPQVVTVSAEAVGAVAIPDDGLRLQVTGPGVPANLTSIRCLPSAGPHADTPTPLARLKELGLATNAILPDLRGQGALIERGTNTFDQKIIKAALAGAEFAVIYNFATNPSTASCPGGDQLCLMGATDFVPLPAVFIGHNDGVALKELFATNGQARARIVLNSAKIPLDVADPLSCEHVGLRLQTDHPLRGDVRITLVSPSGTRSVLQQYNGDLAAGPVDWTYWTTHHFFEPSAGRWWLEVSDESFGASGNVLSATLFIHGVPLDDFDSDGLDDTWEFLTMGGTEFGAIHDLDEDGYGNAVEQVLGTDPLMPNEALRLDLALWNPSLARLSWPAVDARTYEILAGPDPAQLTVITNIPGRFPEAEWFIPARDVDYKFFRVREVRP